MKKVLILLLFAIGLVGCNKWEHQYPEDTVRSKETPLKRLVDKWWILQNVTVDGKNYTDSVKNKIGDYKIIFKNEKAAQSGTKYVLGAIASSSIEPEILSYWRMSDNEESFGLSRFGGYPSIETYAMLYGILTHSFKILQLEKNIFKIENIDSNKKITNTFIAL